MEHEYLITAAIGPNPAPIAEAIWALTRQPNASVVEVHLAALARGHHYLHAELLGEAGALAELRDQLAPGQCPPQERVIEHLAQGGSGELVASDDDDHGARLYREAVWRCAREALRRAGDRTVVFLLAGGRQRTMTAYSATVYQLLARPGDVLYDVRVSDRRAEGGSGFFFPTQRARYIQTAGGGLDATAVEVSLVPVRLPQLGPLVAPQQLESFDSALAASQRLLEGLVPPSVVVDLRQGEIRVNERPLPLSDAQVAWYAALCVQRTREPGPEPMGLPSDPSELLPELLPGVQATHWVMQGIREPWMRKALGVGPYGKQPGEPDEPDEPGEKLKKLRADTLKRVARWVDEEGRPGWESWLVPHKHIHDRVHFQTLRIPSDRIRVVPAVKPG